ncbi:hypothetical protein QYM36_008946 [Artemia franciscana]|uniref:PiggyBac transposable element-derived protein domain-containing protein n=1 Tax=Artemia franciscana TaxID=6661 RepID=A0AA88HRU7_ARTSF|nr:hypothetical protein QYM36_008946 [Artemia franciscana]
MGQFLGSHILMGIIKQPTISQHWGRATRFPLIADVMSRDRFKTLRRFFHANDSHLAVLKGQDGYDSLFKLRPVIDGLQVNLKKIPAEERQRIDEQMVPYKGKLSFKQYLKDKPNSWGIKIFSRAWASGIIYDFEVYTGKGSVPINELGRGAEVVLRLAEMIPRNENFKLFF